jgi:hypothetical protein
VDWDKQPHLSLDVFSASREFNSEREYGYRRGPYGYGRPYGDAPYASPDAYGAPGFGRPGYGAPGFGAPGFGAPGYGGGLYRPFGRADGWSNRSLFGSDSAFALRYGDAANGPALGVYSPLLGYGAPGAGYGWAPAPFGYPPGFGYGVHPAPFGYPYYGWQPPYFSAGPGNWAPGSMAVPPTGQHQYFGW